MVMVIVLVVVVVVFVGDDGHESTPDVIITSMTSTINSVTCRASTTDNWSRSNSTLFSFTFHIYNLVHPSYCTLSRMQLATWSIHR